MGHFPALLLIKPFITLPNKVKNSDPISVEQPSISEAPRLCIGNRSRAPERCRSGWYTSTRHHTWPGFKAALRPVPSAPLGLWLRKRPGAGWLLLVPALVATSCSQLTAFAIAAVPPRIRGRVSLLGDSSRRFVPRVRLKPMRYFWRWLATLSRLSPVTFINCTVSHGVTVKCTHTDAQLNG